MNGKMLIGLLIFTLVLSGCVQQIPDTCNIPSTEEEINNKFLSTLTKDLTDLKYVFPSEKIISQKQDASLGYAQTYYRPPKSIIEGIIEPDLSIKSFILEMPEEEYNKSKQSYINQEPITEKDGLGKQTELRTAGTIGRHKNFDIFKTYITKEEKRYILVNLFNFESGINFMIEDYRGLSDEEAERISKELIDAFCQ